MNEIGFVREAYALCSKQLVTHRTNFTFNRPISISIMKHKCSVMTAQPEHNLPLRAQKSKRRLQRTINMDIPSCSSSDIECEQTNYDDFQKSSRKPHNKEHARNIVISVHRINRS